MMAGWAAARCVRAAATGRRGLQESSRIKSLRYRAEIDGLRALAVAAVILYHAGVPGFAGGYLGVDVFFVISGFLITQLLESSAGDHRLRTLTEFYLRRARRLLPALYVLLAVSALVAALLYLPDELRRFGRSLLLATVLLGNFGAARDGGYFSPDARFTPLRHLWSIGVEEQFYLLFPLFLFALALLPAARRRWLVAASLLLSLGLSYWAAGRWPVQNYYMLPTRAWELLIGVLLALSPAWSQTSARSNQLLSLAALAALGTVICQARVIGFPGIPTVVACVSTAVLISSNSRSLTAVGRALSWRPLVLTGLISYSLYLWHAPILAFYSYYNIKDPSWPALLVLLCAIYLVAYLSWAAVEKPVRAMSLPRFVRLLPLTVLPLTVLLGGFGYWLRFGPQTIDDPIYAALNPACLELSTEQLASGALCSFGPQDEAAPKVVVWGDSHAYALLLAYRDLADAQRVRIYYGVKGACWPLLGAEAASSGEFWRANCARFNAAMAQGIQHLRPQRVILNAYWLDPGAAAEQEFLRRGRPSNAQVMGGIERTLATAHSAGASVCAVLTVPGYSYPIPYALTMAERRHLNPATLTIPRNEGVGQYQTVEGDLRQLASQRQLQVADPKDALCPPSGCLIAAKDGTALYRDANHLSLAGSRVVATVLESCLQDLKR
jgi:peptidoglycan/LPS O-acetylase OafA/YrhL